MPDPVVAAFARYLESACDDAAASGSFIKISSLLARLSAYRDARAGAWQARIAGGIGYAIEAEDCADGLLTSLLDTRTENPNRY